MKILAKFLANDRKNRAKSSRKLRLEALENRELLSADGITPLITTAQPASQLVVNSLDDGPYVTTDNVVTLREAIAAAVENAASDYSSVYGRTTVTFDPELQGRIVLKSPIDITFTKGPRTITVDGVTGSGGKIEVAGQFNITGQRDDYSADYITNVVFRNLAFVGDDSNVSDYVFYKNRIVNLTVENSIVQHYNLSLGVVVAKNTVGRYSGYVNVESVVFQNSVIYKNTFTTSQAQVVSTWHNKTNSGWSYNSNTQNGRHTIAFRNSSITDNVCAATDSGEKSMFNAWNPTNRTYAFYNSIIYQNTGFDAVIKGKNPDESWWGGSSSPRVTVNNCIFEYDPSPGLAEGDNWYQITTKGTVLDKSEDIIYENGVPLKPIVLVENSFLPAPGSLTVNRGNNSYVPRGVTTDIAGNTRIVDTVVDIGAYEGVFSIPEIVVTTESDDFNHNDDFYYGDTEYADGTVKNISLREAFLYSNFFNVETYQNLIVIENVKGIPAIMRSFDRTNPDPDAASPYFSQIEFAAKVKDCTLTLGEPIEVHRDVTLVGKNRGGVNVTINAANNYAHVYKAGVDGHVAGEYFQTEDIDLSAANVPNVDAAWLAQNTTQTTDKARVFTLVGDATFTVNDITFKNGSQTTSLGGTGTSGGVFYIYEDSKLEGQNLTFTGNSAAKYGGAIFNKGEVELAGTTKFEGNSAALGGAVYNRGTFTVYYDPEAEGIPARTSVSFKENEAKGAVSNGAMANGSGAAIYNTSNATVNVSDATFDQNTADKYGGAISNFGILNVENADFLGNTAGSGGAIQSAGSASVVEAKFTGNKAVKRSATLSGSDFGGNGGAIFASKNASNAAAEANLTLTGEVKFNGNTASNAGGALDFISGSLTFESADMVFTGNSAGVVGGAIVVANDNIDSQGSTYTAENNETGFYAKTIAANCAFKSEAASNIKEAFGLITSAQRGTDAEYSIPRSKFDTFVRYKSAMSADSIIEFSYLAGMVETEPESITVYYGSTSVTIYPESDDSSKPSSVKLSDLGITQPGTYAINFYINDVSQIAFTLNVSLASDYCMMARLIDLDDPHTAFTGVIGYTFKSYADVAVQSWTINWGDGQSETFEELGYYINAYHWYASEGDYPVDLIARYADDTVHNFERIATSHFHPSEALLDEVFLTEDFFADEDLFFENFD